MDWKQNIAGARGLADVLFVAALVILVFAALILLGLFLAETGAALSTQVLKL